MANERKSTGVVKQVEAKGFDKPGDMFEGTYLGVKSTFLNDPKAPNGKREAKLYSLAPDEGERYAVWGSTQLDDLMTQVQVGTYVKITFKETLKAGKGRQPMKVFEIETFE